MEPMASGSEKRTSPAMSVSTSALFILTIRVASGDYLGDGRTDLGVFQLNPTTFLFQRSPTTRSPRLPLGKPRRTSRSMATSSAMDRDDVALYRPSTSTFYAYDVVTGAILDQCKSASPAIPRPRRLRRRRQDRLRRLPAEHRRLDHQHVGDQHDLYPVPGSPGDVPVPADYYGNGHADIAVYHPSTSIYSVYDQTTGASGKATIGLPGSIPMPGDDEGLGNMANSWSSSRATSRGSSS